MKKKQPVKSKVAQKIKKPSKELLVALVRGEAEIARRVNDLDDDKVSDLWFKRHRIKYHFTAESPIAVKLEHVHKDGYAYLDHFIRAPFPKAGIARWGFLTEADRAAFCKRHGGKVHENCHRLRRERH